MVVIDAAVAKVMYMAAKGKTETQWDETSINTCKDIVVTALRLLNCTAKTSVCGGPINAKVKEKLNLPGDLRKFVLDFEFKVAHVSMHVARFTVQRFDICNRWKRSIQKVH